MIGDASTARIIVVFIDHFIAFALMMLVVGRLFRNRRLELRRSVG